MLLFIMLIALWLRLNSQDVKWLIIKADVFALLFCFNQKEVLDVREPCNLMVLDVIEACFYFVMVHDVIEPFSCFWFLML